MLRCANPAGHVVRLSDEDAAQLEGAICGEHQALLDAGAPALWQVDPVHMTTGSIVMGSDVAAGGLIITGLVGSEKGGYLLGPECGGAVTVVLETVDGGGAREEARLTMSKRVATELGQFLGRGGT